MNRLLWEESGVLIQVENMLKKGGILLTSTDTVLGLLSDISKDSFIKLNSIKKRTDKPYLVLISDGEKALQFIDSEHKNNIQIEKLIKFCWPGPVTLICKAKSTIPVYIQSREGTIALRVPDHSQLRLLLQKFQGLFSTSANTSGVAIPKAIDEVEKVIIEAVDGIVLDKTEKEKDVPSTIIDCTGYDIKIVRQGEFSIERIEEILGQKLVK